MEKQQFSEKTLKLAEQCKNCKPCEKARHEGRGFTYWMLKLIGAELCPACRAYKKVYGKPAYMP